MENNTDHSEHLTPITVQEVDVDFLPIVYEIIRRLLRTYFSVERDFHDNTAKVRESQDCSLKVLDLQKKLDFARAQIKRLPGIEFNKQDQLKQFEILQTQLRLKRELLQKYRNMCSFETSFK
ncbi:mediator of RNA polymerase II transcription subunit 9 isoform X1 [Colias croceus]|uniref:mediator of RNA polymerase II transcription subunit 9 isoform X1 n=1 Tax=Colias crocea TaxID=72248 RepID=UPI001E27F1D7|nr:mediator of RNA polymerase II transcription subunit 9 isoform X1 [Colias croceus]